MIRRSTVGLTSRATASDRADVRATSVPVGSVSKSASDSILERLDQYWENHAGGEF